jgi:hypothetical protein
MQQTWLEFGVVMAAFEDYDASAADVKTAMTTTRRMLAETPDDIARAVETGFEYWASAFERFAVAPDRAALRDLVREYLCTPHAHAQSSYNIVQGAMKAAIHVALRRLHAIETAWRTNPRDAIRDALTHPRERAHELMGDLYEEIAASAGETVVEMTDRVVAQTPRS